MLEQLPTWPANTPEYEVLAIRYGSVELTKARQFLNHHAYGEADAPITLDYYFWVIRNETETIVVDTGFDVTAARRRGRNVLVDPCEAFGRVGVDPGLAPKVIVTHAHWDHIGNLRFFPHSELIVTHSEIEFLRGPYSGRTQYAEHMERAETQYLLSAVDEGRGTVIRESHPPAPGIETVEVGGHTPGEMIVLVNTASGALVLASDAIHFYEEYDEDKVYAVLSDLQGMYRTYDHVRWVLDGTGGTLIPGHDPDVACRFPKANGALGDIATLVSEPPTNGPVP